MMENAQRLSDERSEIEGEALPASPMKGATRAPLIAAIMSVVEKGGR